MIQLKSAEQILLMRRAGLVVAEGLDAMTAAVRAGVTTAEIDAVGREVLARRGATSNFLGYGAEYGTPFPAVACISVNEELVHGIPGPRVLADGDVVSIDFGAVVEGWHGDAARTVVVGQAAQEDLDLIDVVQDAFWAGTRRMRAGGKVSDISKAIEQAIRAHGRYGVLRDFTGHGIGDAMHMAPDVPNYHVRGRSPVIEPGTVLAIEPMVTRGTHRTLDLDDGWTVVSRDGSRGAHWENTVALTERGLWVLTEPDGGQSLLGDLFGPLGD